MQNKKYRLITPESNLSLFGGNYDDRILINFVYFKILNKDGDGTKQIIEPWTNLYIVDADYKAYKMNQGILSNMYVISMHLPINQIFKFKFMRDDKIEFLDEDVDLLSLSHDIPKIDEDADAARWRFIYPNESNDKQIHVYTYCVPNLIFDENLMYAAGPMYATNLFQRNESRRKPMPFDTILSQDTKIQNKKQIKVYDNYGGKFVETIDINDVTLKQNDGIWLHDLIRHNLGNDISHTAFIFNMTFESGSEVQYNDIKTMYAYYHNNGCKVENLYLYFSEYVETKINRAATSLKIIESEAKKLGFSKEKYLGKELFHDSFYAAETVNQYKYNNDQICYKINQSTSKLEISSVINNLSFKMTINGTLETNTILVEIDKILQNIALISEISLDKFGNLPLSIVQYIEFFKKYKLTSLQYMFRCEIINKLLQVSKGKNLIDETIEISDANIKGKIIWPLSPDTYYNISTTYANVGSNDEKAFSKKFMNIISAFKGVEQEKWLINKKLKSYFSDIMYDHILTLKWLDQYIFGLYASYTSISVAETENEAAFTYLQLNPNLGSESGPIAILNSIVQTNIGKGGKYQIGGKKKNGKNKSGEGVKSGEGEDGNEHQLFNFLVQIKHIVEDELNDNPINNINLDIITFDNNMNYTAKNIYSTPSNKILRNLRSLLNNNNNNNNGDNYKSNPRYDPLNSDITTYNKIIDNEFNIKGLTIDRVSSLLSLFRKQINRLSKAFWLKLDDMNLNQFLTDPTLSQNNLAKIYLKMLYIVNFCNSSNGNKLLSILKPPTNTNKPLFSVKPPTNTKKSSPSSAPPTNTKKSSDNPIHLMPSFDYYEFLNENVTFNKLIKLAMFNNIAGYYAVELDETIYTFKEAKIFDITLKNTVPVDLYNTSPKPTQFAHDNAIFRHNNKIMTVEEVLANVMANIMEGSINAKIDAMYNKILSRTITIIPTPNLTY